jgi:SAM-dependent methyltransferase
MMVATQLERLLRKTWFRICPPKGKAEARITLPKLLAQMDAYDWDSVEDIPVNEDERRERLKYFNEVIGASGVKLNGSLLDLASGTASLAYLYPDTVAIDNDPRKTKILRRDGIKAVIADIEDLPFENKSFDYVASFSPPQKQIILHSSSDGCCRFVIDQECNRKLVDAALRIARKKALIASYAIAVKPPYEYLIEKRDTNGYYFVLYRASSDPV